VVWSGRPQQSRHAWETIQFNDRRAAAGEGAFSTTSIKFSDDGSGLV